MSSDIYQYLLYILVLFKCSVILAMNKAVISAIDNRYYKELRVS